MPPVRKTAATPVAPPPPPPVVEGVNFLAPDFYAGGSTIPEGTYALEFEVKMHQAEDPKTHVPKGAARLGAMVYFYPINEKGESTGEAREKFYSFGSNAHQSFSPGADGKRLVKVPNGQYNTLMPSTNWFMLLQSLWNCGMPTTLESNDFTVVDGVWVRTQNVPEPEERKSFAKNKTAKTGEAAEEAAAADEEKDRKPGLVCIVSEILDGGKPWEGGGGLPDGEAKAETPAAEAPKTGPRPVAAPVAAPTVDDEDLNVQAVNLIAAQLEANPDGMKRLKLRTEVFKAAGDKGEAVMGVAFKSDDTLNRLLNQLGYQIVGSDIKPQ